MGKQPKVKPADVKAKAAARAARAARRASVVDDNSDVSAAVSPVDAGFYDNNRRPAPSVPVAKPAGVKLKK